MTEPAAYVDVAPEGDRIWVLTEGGDFAEMVARCKAVRGARWRKVEKVWSYPLAVDTCTDLREAFGTMLVLSEDVKTWFKAQQAAAATHADLSRETDATLTRLPLAAPGLAATLRADQRVGVAWVARLYRDAGLVADEPGLGKTLEVIGGVLEADLQGGILVTCPRLSVKAVWQTELRRWAPDERVYVARGTRAKRTRAIMRFMEDPAPRKWLIVVAETLRVKEEDNPNDPTGKKKQFAGYEYPMLFDKEWAAVVVDESHKMFGSLTVVRGNLSGKGLKRLPTRRRLAVTGTPFGKGGRLQGMFGTLHWLWPDEFTSFWRWAERHFVIEEEEVYIRGGFGRTRATKRVGDLRGDKSEEQFLRELGPRILRRLKEEVMPWLPKKQYVEVLCEMEDQQLKQYRQLTEDAEVTVPGGVISADGVLAEITRAKQLASGALYKDGQGNVKFNWMQSCKVAMLFEKLEDRGILDGSGHMKVLVASQFNELLEAVVQRLEGEDVEYYLLTGKTSDAKRDAMMEDFRFNPSSPRVFLLNAKAGGVSVNLDSADEVHVLDELWDPGDMGQLEDRAHRASRSMTPEQADDRPPVIIYNYRTEGTIDTNIGESVEERRANQHAVLDGRRGVAYVRSVVQYRKPTEDNEGAA